MNSGSCISDSEWQEGRLFFCAIDAHVSSCVRCAVGTFCCYSATTMHAWQCPHYKHTIGVPYGATAWAGNGIARHGTDNWSQAQGTNEAMAAWQAGRQLIKPQRSSDRPQQKAGQLFCRCDRSSAHRSNQTEQMIGGHAILKMWRP